MSELLRIERSELESILATAETRMMEAKYGKTIESQKRRKIYDFIEEYQREHGISPALDVIAAQIGKSLGTTSYHIGVMAAKGILSRDETTKGIQLNPEYARGVYVKVSAQ